MIGELTKKQEELVSVYQKKWYDKFHGLSFDEKKVKDYVNWLYKLVDAEPPKIIILDSPLACQLAANKKIFGSRLLYRFTPQLGFKLNFQFCHHIDAWVCEQLRHQFNIRNFYHFDWFGDVSCIGCLLCFEKVCFISRPPVFINFDEKNRLHCLHDGSVCFADGWKMYCVHGVSFDEKLFKKAFVSKSITSEEILKIDNAEQKAVIIQELGFEKVFDGFKNKKIVDKQTKSFNKNKDFLVDYVLFDVDFGGNTNVRVLKVEWYERGRKRQTFLGVPNSIDDAIEAVAWTCYHTKEDWENKLLKEA